MVQYNNMGNNMTPQKIKMANDAHAQTSNTYNSNFS